MPALTRTQEKREEARKKEQHSKALRALRKLLESKEKKDMLDDAKIRLHDAEDVHEGLYLTRGGLLEITVGSQTGMESLSRYYPKLTLELVQQYDLSEAKLHKVQKQLKE